MVCRAAAIALLVAACAAPALALYDASDAVVQLTDKDFDKTTRSGVWLVEVYAPWCGHCKNAAGDVKAAAKMLKGVGNIAVVDGDKAGSATAQKLGVKGFPTFKLIVDGKATDYTGGRDAKSMVGAVMQAMGELMKTRMGGGGKPSSSSSSGGKPSGGKPSGGGGNAHGPSEPGGGKHVITGTADNFAAEVLNSVEPVLVEFYAPWCGHCKSLAAPLAAAAAELVGEAKVVAVDATAHGSLGTEYGVKGFPTLKYFPPGAKSAGSAQDYNGGRDKESIVAGVRALTEKAGGAVGVATQLTGAAAWDEHCGGKRVCVLAFLPPLLDEPAARRNERLAALSGAAGKVNRGLFRLLWSEAGAQPALEAALGVGMTPAVVAVSASKLVFTPYRGAVEAAALAKWVNSLAVRNDGAAPFPGGKPLPAAATVPAWDGKDAAPAAAAAEEFSLEDLGL